MSSNTRYDQFRFVEAPIDNLSVVPPEVTFPYLGQYYYSIYECYTSGSTNPSLAYNQVESGRAVVIVGNDTEYDCLYDQFVSDNEENANIIFISEKEDDCINVTLTPTPSVTASNTPTPTLTPTNTTTPTVTPTCPVTTQYLKVNLGGCHNFSLSLWEDSAFTIPDNALCNYIVSGTAYGDMGTVYTGTETIQNGDHTHSFNLNPVLQPGECVSGFTVNGVNTSACQCPVNVIYTTITPTPTPTPTATPTYTPTPTPTSGIASLVVTSGQSWYEACNIGTPVTIYFVDNGICTPCLPFNCFPCLQNIPIYSNPQLTNLVANGFYSKEMAPGNVATWEFINGYSSNYLAPCPPNPTPSPTGITHSYSWTGYTSQGTACDAFTGQTTTVTLYANDPTIDNNLVFFDSPTGPNTTNLYGSYALWNGSIFICFSLDSYGVAYSPFFICSAFC